MAHLPVRIRLPRTTMPRHEHTEPTMHPDMHTEPTQPDPVSGRDRS